MLVTARRILGLGGMGLGIAAAAAPERFASALGMADEVETVRAFGAREIAAGAGLLSATRPGPWLWMQVGADATGALAFRKAIRRDNPRRGLALAATSILALIAMTDLILAVRASTEARAART
jgi:hypothetical protein